MPPDIRLEGRNPVAKPIPTHAESSNPPDDTFVASVSHVGGLRSNSPSDNSTEQQVAHWLLDGWQVLVRSGNQCLEMGHQPTPPLDDYIILCAVSLVIQISYRIYFVDYPLG